MSASTEARDRWRTMTGEQYMAYLNSLMTEEAAAPAQRFEVKSAEELAELPSERTAREARERIRTKYGENGVNAFKAFEVIEASEFADNEDSEPDWQIRGLIPTVGTGLHTGASGTLKSFAELELASCIHRGVPFHGLTVTRGRAVIICAEGARGFKRRFRAKAKAAGVSLADLPAIIPCAANLFESSQVAALIEQIRLAGGATYVVFDTKIRCSVGADENSATDQAVVMGAMDRIARQLNCFVMAVTHTGRDASKGARGSTAQYAAVDVELTQERAGDYCTMRVSKAKDSEADIVYTFKIEKVDLGRNQHDEPESSLVLEPVGTAPPASKQAPRGSSETGLYQLLKTKAPIHREDLLDEFAALVKRNGSKITRSNLRRTLASLEAKRLAFINADDEVSMASDLVQDESGWTE